MRMLFNENLDFTVVGEEWICSMGMFALFGLSHFYGGIYLILWMEEILHQLVTGNYWELVTMTWNTLNDGNIRGILPIYQLVQDFATIRNHSIPIDVWIKKIALGQGDGQLRSWSSTFSQISWDLSRLLYQNMIQNHNPWCILLTVPKMQQRTSGGLQNLERGQPRCEVGLA